MGFQGGGEGVQFSKSLDFGGSKYTGLAFISKLSNYIYVSFKSRQKNTLWWFFVSTILKMSPVLSLALEPISSFSYQE